MDAAFAEKGIPLKPQIEVAVHDLLIRFASIHLGISCVVEEFAMDSFKNGSIKKINLTPALGTRHIGCAYLKHSALSPAAKAFLELIKK